jgi:MFS family permease
VVFLTAIAPLATDMYVPAFPQVAGELSTTATQAQLTLTTFFVGMALGQLIGGPVSDHRGRRVPLLWHWWRQPRAALKTSEWSRRSWRSDRVFGS